MEAESQIAKLIKITNNKAKYDAQVKKLLANKAILAWILKTCTEEFAQFDPSEIVGFVEGDPEISTKAVHATDLDIGDEMVDGDQSIEGINTEDNGLKEQTIFYDIRLNACVPGQEQPIQLIINIEAQLDTAPGYPIEKRAIYYGSRLISAQYGTVFQHSEYGKICKVYTIWFCLNPAKKRQNTIKKIAFMESSLFGSIETHKQDTDLLQAIIVNLGDPEEDVDNQILRLMNVLLSSKTSVQDKQKVMHDEFRISMTSELESEVSDMCNLSQGIFNDGVEKGMEKGMEKGIQGAVELLHRAGLSDQKIIEEIMLQYHLSKEEAEEYVLTPASV